VHQALDRLKTSATATLDDKIAKTQKNNKRLMFKLYNTASLVHICIKNIVN